MRRPQELDDPDRHGRRPTTAEIFEMYERCAARKDEEDEDEAEEWKPKSNTEFPELFPEHGDYRLSPRENFFVDLPRSAGVGRVIGWVIIAVAIGVALSMLQRWIES